MALNRFIESVDHFYGLNNRLQTVNSIKVNKILQEFSQTINLILQTTQQTSEVFES